MIIFEVIFYSAFFMVFYIYFGYPLLVSILASFRKLIPQKNAFEPKISILISAYNEEMCIEKSLNNKLDLRYPKEKLEIIVISDGSTDKTEEIVKRFEGKRVKLLRQEPRAGKTQALNMAVPRAEGDFLVFSDANSIYETGAIEELVKNFSDSTVGYVTGHMKYVNLDGSLVGDGCSTYMKYENFLREKETKIGSIVGVDGGIDAIRKDLYLPMKAEQLPDFVLPLTVIERGYRVIYEPAAILREPTLSSPEDEYQMRVRVSLRALWALKDMKKLLISRQFKLFSFQLWSHKILRYLAFIFLFFLYVTNLQLYQIHFIYKSFFIIQTVFYFSAILAFISEKLGLQTGFLYPAQYFVLLNVAAAHAFFKFLLGKKQVTWIPRKGK